MRFRLLFFRTGLLLISVFLVSGKSLLSQNSNFDKQREQMVATQIQARGITDKIVLEAFRKVPRHKFVLPKYQQYAYIDSPLPIDEGQTISQPYIVAFMTDVLDLKASDKVLEIGTGSGYQAAILAELCDSVFTIDIFELLVNKTTSVFKELKYTNIYAKTADGYKGWPEHAPFDAIIVTCSPTHIPQPLKEQLAEGGKMIIPVGPSGNQKLILLEKRKGKLKEKDVLPVRFVPMINAEKERY